MSDKFNTPARARLEEIIEILPPDTLELAQSNPELANEQGAPIIAGFLNQRGYNVNPDDHDAIGKAIMDYIDVDGTGKDHWVGAVASIASTVLPAILNKNKSGSGDQQAGQLQQLQMQMQQEREAAKRRQQNMLLIAGAVVAVILIIFLTKK